MLQSPPFSFVAHTENDTLFELRGPFELIVPTFRLICLLKSERISNAWLLESRSAKVFMELRWIKAWVKCEIFVKIEKKFLKIANLFDGSQSHVS